MTMADDRLLSADLGAAELAPDADGGPLSTAGAPVGRFGDVRLGLWEAGPGHDTDTEVDEVFVVLSGAGTVRFADGSELGLRPGVVVRLHAGDETVWDVTERLRKLYLA